MMCVTILVVSETHHIYGLFDSVTGECRYVGRTDNPQKRWNRHASDARVRSSYIYGIPSPKELWLIFCLNNGSIPNMVALEECEKSEAPIREDYWVQEMLDRGHRLTNTHRIKGNGRLHQDYHEYTRCKRWKNCPNVERFDNYNGFPLVKPKQNYLNNLKGV